MDLSLKGRRALVCGSTQGIGRASAIVLARLGASVTLMARNQETLTQTAEALACDSGQEHDWLVADFSDPDGVKQAIGRALDDGRTYHVLVNNTGGPPGGQAIDAHPEEFERAFRAHVVCNQVLVQALVARMKAAGYGRIVNIISTSVRQPIPGLGVSNTVRGAVASWAKTLSMELAGFGITVNNVLPGFTETARLMGLIRAKAKARGASEEAIAEEMRSSVPMGRFGDPEEIANAVAFLASPAAAYISGQSLAVDGARTSAL
ncbi:MAG: SDR family oxidoreductase [Phycisphaeraceae bacterium]|nr:SDR family oxidoreductase [Phycisphaeraceae bacterium]